MIATTNEVKTSSIKRWGGAYLIIKYETWEPRYTDEYAMMDELADFNQYIYIYMYGKLIRWII